MSYLRRFAILVASLVLGGSSILISASLASATEDSASNDSVNCQEYPQIPVSLQDGQPANYTIYGKLCATPTELRNGNTVQLLIPGGTYSSVYWDLPYQPALYSYARNEARLGYPTFTFDRIGTGKSSHPAGALVDANANVFVAHQMVQLLKNGSNTGVHFGKVIEVGHSLGSAVSLMESVTYRDVDGLILTGFDHSLNLPNLQAFQETLYPANQDPRFQNAGLDNDYLTTKPGTRGQYFYNSSFADPKVIATDDGLKETSTNGEFASIPGMFDPSLSQQATVPVLLLVGQQDALSCSSEQPCDSDQQVAQREAADYSPQVCLQTHIIPQAGHDVALHYNALIEVNYALAWSERFVGKSGSSHPPGC